MDVVAQVPVFKGSGKTLLDRAAVHAHHVHGADGLGGLADPDPPSLDLVQPEHAVHALLRLSRERPGQITLLAIGPLTNLALAMRIDPDFTGRLKKLVIMGGNTEGESQCSFTITRGADVSTFLQDKSPLVVNCIEIFLHLASHYGTRV